MTQAAMDSTMVAVTQAGIFPRIVAHDDALAAAQNFINAHFRNEGRGVLTGIPARPEHDDLLLTDYIKQQRALTRHQSGRTGAGEAGWIVGNSGGTKWRCWGSVGPDWTDDRDKATRYARRIDAERVHAEDDDAWRVVPYAAVETGS